jgi:hypothetical protein
MKKKSPHLVLLAICGLIIPVSLPANAQDAPQVIKSTLYVTNRKDLVYWPNPKAKEPQYNTWTWSPRIKFDVRGPLTGGSQIIVDFMYPDGKKWLSENCETPELAKDIASPISCLDFSEKQGIIKTGAFKFKIHVKNELEGNDQTIYSGRFIVNKFHVGNNLATFKNQFEYYVEQDWVLPMGYATFAVKKASYSEDLEYDEVPVYKLWLKKEEDTYNLAGYLYYKGNQIASTKDMGMVSDHESMYPPGDDKDRNWGLFGFRFYKVHYFMTDPEKRQENYFYMNENPGEYELKVLRSGKLVRSMKFSFGTDGKIVNPVNFWEFKYGGEWRVLLPVKVIGNSDGNWNKAMWKTDMFYGSPYPGFQSLN